MNKFLKKETDGIIIEQINLKRATYNDSEELKNRLISYLEDGYTKIIIDLSNCNFMDSAFLGSIIYGLKKTQESGGNLMLAEPHGDAKVILEITGAIDLFLIFNSVDEAVKNFQQGVI